MSPSTCPRPSLEPLAQGGRTPGRIRGREAATKGRSGGRDAGPGVPRGAACRERGASAFLSAWSGRPRGPGEAASCCHRPVAHRRSGQQTPFISFFNLGQQLDLVRRWAEAGCFAWAPRPIVTSPHHGRSPGAARVRRTPLRCPFWSPEAGRRQRVFPSAGDKAAT